MESVPSKREYLDLSGTWQLVFDPRSRGLAEGWAIGNYPAADARDIAVPAPWNVACPNAEGVGFYRRRFDLPASWAGRTIGLCFGGAAYRAEAWLNGHYLGSHEGAYTPFRFNATPAANIGGENELIVRVASLSRSADVDGMVLRHSPASKQSWYYTYGGLWGDVQLLGLPRLAIYALRVEPDLRAENVLIDVEVQNAHESSRPANLRLQIGNADGYIAAEQAAR